MKTQARDLISLLDGSLQAKEELEKLTFVPPLRVVQHSSLPDPEAITEEPLAYLVGHLPELSTPGSMIEWMDQLRAADGAPVALLLPRPSFDWTAAATHPQFCGLLPCRPEIPMGAMERILHGARLAVAARWGQSALRRASFAWTFSTQEAADPEQAWLLMESSLSSMVGPSSDLSCLGMAFAEALTNAVEHGNLELESSLKETSNDGLFRFFAERQRRLSDPVYGKRRIRVTVQVRESAIRVRIRNQGPGYDPSLRMETAPPPHLLSHGLGMAMIEKLVDSAAVSQDGRSITLTHRMPQRRLRARGPMPSLLMDGPDRRLAA